MNSQLLDQLRTIVCEQLDVAPERVSEGTSFVDDLGADSLDLVELAMTLEGNFSLDIPDADYAQFSTVGNALKYLEARLEAQGV